MKNVGPIRKELAVKTFFNMLGPMDHPHSSKMFVKVTYSLEMRLRANRDASGEADKQSY
jgi:anthranilate phosphoribosyltransferase